ncbi:MAG: hypothetical protein J6328_02040 [Bacilli bacterium]|nr:hypothetical protein [Bacilli bacterium]
MNPETKKLWEEALSLDQAGRRAIAQRAFRDVVEYLFPLFAKWEKVYAFVLKVLSPFVNADGVFQIEEYDAFVALTGGTQFSYEQIRDIMTIYANEHSQKEVEEILKDAPKEVLLALGKIGICITAADGVITEKEEASVQRLLMRFGHSID